MANNNNYSFDYDYPSDAHGYDNGSLAEAQKIRNLFTYMYTGTFSTIVLLGVPLNCLVIVTTFHTIKRNQENIWFPGMAITDLIFCLFLPFHIVSAWEDYTWRFGWIVCKLTSMVTFVSMYSTAFILTCMILAQLFSNMVFHTCCRFSLYKGMLLMSWSAAAILSCPSLIFRIIHNEKNRCMDDYRFKEDRNLKNPMRKYVTLYLRFIVGFLLPAVSSRICWCLLVLRSNGYRIQSSMRYRMLTAVLVTHCLCWLPLLSLQLFQLHSLFSHIPDLFSIGLPVSTALAGISGCIKPIIYIVLGNSFWLSWMNAK